MGNIKLILKESVHSLGEAGDLVVVKPGFARNFLLPQGKAILATERRVKELEHHKRIVAEKAAREMTNLRQAKAQLDKVKIEITARAGEEGRLFGSVTAAQIAERLLEQGYEIDRRRIELREPIKELGDHAVPVKLHRDVVAKVTVKVVPDGTPAPEDLLDEEEAEERAERRRRRDEEDEEQDERRSGRDEDEETQGD